MMTRNVRILKGQVEELEGRVEQLTDIVDRLRERLDRSEEDFRHLAEVLGGSGLIKVEHVRFLNRPSVFAITQFSAELRLLKKHLGVEVVFREPGYEIRKVKK